MKIQIQFKYIERDLKTQKNRIGYQMQAFDAIQYTSFTKKKPLLRGERAIKACRSTVSLVCPLIQK